MSTNVYLKMWTEVLLGLSVALCIPAAIVAQTPTSNVSTECGILRPDQFYNLEKTIVDNEFPWMARLLSAEGDFLCMGVLIGSRYVISSARCLTGSHRYGIFIVELGSCKIKDICPKRIEVQTFVQNSQHVLHKLTHDIALLRLKEPVEISDYIRPICLPGPEVVLKDFSAQHYTMTGRHILGGLAAKHVVLIVDNARCQRSFEGLTVDDSVLCANTCDNGSKYYSGSALMDTTKNNTAPYRYYLVGILTSGVHGCVDSTPDVFQRIDRHLNWIRETVLDMEQRR